MLDTGYGVLDTGIHTLGYTVGYFTVCSGVNYGCANRCVWYPHHCINITVTRDTRGTRYMVSPYVVHYGIVLVINTITSHVKLFYGDIYCSFKVCSKM